MADNKGNEFAAFMAEAEARDPEAFARARAEQTELAALRKDAERYRWLRDNASCQWDLGYQHVEVVFPLDEEEWENMDDAVDRAIAAAPAVGAA